MESLGQRIFRFRKATKLSQTQLGARIGVSQATISQYEDGTINIPSNQLAAIATALNVAESDLLDKVAKSPEMRIEDMRLELIRLALSATEPDLRSAIRILSGKRSAALNKNESSSG